MERHADVLCFSHLRYDFVFQRPNHLMSRCARERRVFWIEEPVYEAGTHAAEVMHVRDSLWRVIPHLSPQMSADEEERAIAALIAQVKAERDIRHHVAWLYTPMALPVALKLGPSLMVYDCMDELAAFSGASPRLIERERDLFRVADLVFTGGQSLYEAKRGQHHSVYPFPSSVDAAHFGKARDWMEEPADQARIPGPRVGFFGVIDERMDIELLAQIAESRPNVQFIMIGPVVKIDPDTLPKHSNIHYLGQKTYAELPSYLAGWNVAMMPFALNEATRYISPTKTLEYLAAGKPVVSTAIRDVVTPYGDEGSVHIAAMDDFAFRIDRALATDATEHLAMCDQILKSTSWDRTWEAMSGLMDQATMARRESSANQNGELQCSTT